MLQSIFIQTKIITTVNIMQATKFSWSFTVMLNGIHMQIEDSKILLRSLFLSVLFAPLISGRPNLQLASCVLYSEKSFQVQIFNVSVGF